MQLRRSTIRELSGALVANVDLDAVRAALAEWRWLIGDRCEPILVAASGDVFVTDAAGAVVRLDTGSASLERIAESLDEFTAAIADPDNVREWFMSPLVDELRSRGQLLAAGQCYGFSILPIFREGSYEADNRFLLDALEHIRVTGNMHAQLKDIPDGAQVKLDVVD